MNYRQSFITVILNYLIEVLLWRRPHDCVKAFEPYLLKKILSALGMLMLAIYAQAQDKDLGAPIISNFDAKIYKAHSQNWAAIQDNRGVMYFGNSFGIIEFDGQRWQHVVTSGSPMVRSLNMAPDGTIFYGAIGDFGYLSISKTGKLSAVSLKDLIPAEEKVFNDVWQIESTSQGVYFFTRSRLFRFYQGKVTALAGKFASSQAVMMDDTIFYADTEKGVSMIVGGDVVPIPQLAGLFNGRRILLTKMAAHTLLAGRTSGDFQRVDLTPLWDEVSHQYKNAPAASNLVTRLPTEIDGLLNEDNAYMYKLIALDNAQFAISTVKAGIIIFDYQGKLIRVINKNGGLMDNTVAGITFDRAHNLWAATNSGISHIELSVPQSVFGPKNGLDGISISAAYYQGRMYVGSFQNVYVKAPLKYDLKNDVPQFLPLKEGTSEVWQFMEVAGDLLAASGRGLYRIVGESTHKIAHSSGNAYCLGFSPNWPDHIFVGLMGGVEVFKKQGDQWVLLGRLAGVKENVRRISTDVNGDLWLNTEVGGLLRVHFNSDKATDVSTHRIGLEHGLPDLNGSRTSSIGKTMYLVSSKGLYVSQIAAWRDGDKDDTKFVPESRFGKQFSDGSMEVTEIVSDGKDGFLLKTSEGIYAAQPDGKGGYQLNAGAFRGLPSPDDTIFVHPLGGIWLTGESLYRVDLQQKKDQTQSFDAMIRKVTSTGKEAVFEGAHGKSGAMFPSASTIIQSEQEKTNPPELLYSQNELAFEFSANFFEKLGSNQFQYRLEGFDKNWSEWDSVAAKEYTNIPNGNYRFQVRAKNIYGVISKEASYAFRILPPWYRTAWAYCLWLVLAAAVLYGLMRLYTFRLRREKIHLEELVAERTQQLRDATLTDPLTGLRNRRFISEVLQNDVTAFVGYKNYLISAVNNREGMTGKEVFGLFLLDMDHFKHVNDTYGHDAGDHILKQFAEILIKLVRKDDVVIRLGGEEFLIVLKKTRPDYIHVLATKILEAVAAKEFDLGDGSFIHKTCSVGYTAFPVYPNNPDALSFEQGIMIADLAMYHAKHDGRNRAVYLCEGDRMPTQEEEIRKTTTSFDYAIKEAFLRIGEVRHPGKPEDSI